MKTMRAGSTNSMRLAFSRDEHLIADDAEGNARRNEQDDDHDILELLQKAHDERLFLLFGEFVRAELGAQFLRLCGRKPLFGICPEG